MYAFIYSPSVGYSVNYFHLLFTHRRFMAEGQVEGEGMGWIQGVGEWDGRKVFMKSY